MPTQESKYTFISLEWQIHLESLTSTNAFDFGFLQGPGQIVSLIQIEEQVSFIISFVLFVLILTLLIDFMDHSLYPCCSESKLHKLNIEVGGKTAVGL